MDALLVGPWLGLDAGRAAALSERVGVPVGTGALGLFVVCDYIGLHYGRVGLLEPALNALLVWVAFTLLLARRHVLWLIPMTWVFALALLTKQTGLYVAPLVLTFGIPAWLRAARAGSRKRLYQGLVLAHALALGGALVAYALSDAYLRTVLWNFGHVVHGEDGATALDAEGLDVGSIAARFGDLTKLWRFISTYPLTGILATCESARLLRRALKRRAIAPWQKLALVWLGCAALTLFFTKLTDVRFYVLLAPPVTLLADKGQLEQVLLNLCLNARDAMPGGGQIRITLERATLEPADCEKPVSYTHLTLPTSDLV